jgi:hypothetical protein
MWRRGLATSAVLFSALALLPGQNVSKRGEGSAALTVQVGLLESSGKVAPPESAKVYIMYGSQIPDPVVAGEDGRDTAGGQFRMRLNGLLSSDRDLKNLKKRTRRGRESDTANEISEKSLRALDAALAATRDWIAQRPDLAWQLRTVTADRHGERTTLQLEPGPYEIVARGKIGQYDADWEATVTLRPEMTLTLPMTTPRFVCRMNK